MSEAVEHGHADDAVSRRRLLQAMAGGAALAAIPSFVHPAVQGIVKGLAEGSRSSAEWARIPMAGAREFPWQVFQGNKGWMGWLRLMDDPYDAALLMVPKADVAARKAQLPSDAQLAAMWHPGGDEVELAVVDDFRAEPYGLPDHYAIGMGVGKGELRASLGLYVPGTQSVVALENVSSQGPIPSNDLPGRVPGAVWV